MVESVCGAVSMEFGHEMVVLVAEGDTGLENAVQHDCHGLKAEALLLFFAGHNDEPTFRVSHVIQESYAPGRMVEAQRIFEAASLLPMRL
jgi:hypothetical protein